MSILANFTDVSYASSKISCGVQSLRVIMQYVDLGATTLSITTLSIITFSIMVNEMLHSA
jgi:hypothetical protein